MADPNKPPIGSAWPPPAQLRPIDIPRTPAPKPGSDFESVPGFTLKRLDMMFAVRGLRTATPRPTDRPAGVDIAIVSKRLRHSSIKITNDACGRMISAIGRPPRQPALVPLRHQSMKKTA